MLSILIKKRILPIRHSQQRIFFLVFFQHQLQRADALQLPRSVQRALERRRQTGIHSFHSQSLRKDVLLGHVLVQLNRVVVQGPATSLIRSKRHFVPLSVVREVKHLAVKSPALSPSHRQVVCFF